MSKEYYVANQVGEDPRGPYSLEKLKSLAAEKEITPETMYYHEDRQVWVRIKSNDFLLDAIFGETKKLSLKKKSPPAKKKSLKTKPSHPDEVIDKSQNPEGPPVKINEIIDAAAGKVKGKGVDSNKQEKSEKGRARAESLKMYMLLFALFIFSGVFFHLHREDLRTIYQSENYQEILNYPSIIAAIVSAGLGCFLLLGISSFISPARACLMLCTGFFSYFYWSIEASVFMYSLPIGSLLFFFASIASRKRFILLLSSLGLAFLALWAIYCLDFLPSALTELIEKS